MTMQQQGQERNAADLHIPVLMKETLAALQPVLDAGRDRPVRILDGTLGMAYGVSCRTFLKTVAGVPSALASAVVHVAEVPTTLASGLSHIRLKNVDKSLFLHLVIPGVIGGVAGAWFLSSAGDALEPFIDAYLIVMGFIILRKAFRKSQKERHIGKGIYPLGLAGGFLDATGGGGWGPVVTSTMLAVGHDVKKTIGTVNTAEFLVTLAETTTFVVLIRDFTSYWPTILGLVIGGVCAAPLAAWICRKIPVRPLLAIVGILIIALNLYSLLQCLAVF